VTCGARVICAAVGILIAIRTEKTSLLTVRGCRETADWLRFSLLLLPVAVFTVVIVHTIFLDFGMLIHCKVGGKLPRGKPWWVERERERMGEGGLLLWGVSWEVYTLPWWSIRC